MTRPEPSPHAERNADLRQFSDVLCIPQFCDRASCKRAKKCKGNAERCLALYSDCVPLEAREFIVDLMTSRELGYSFEEAVRRGREGVRAFGAWSSLSVSKRLGREVRDTSLYANRSVCRFVRSPRFRAAK